MSLRGRDLKGPDGECHLVRNSGEEGSWKVQDQDLTCRVVRMHRDHETGRDGQQFGANKSHKRLNDVGVDVAGVLGGLA